MVGAPAPINGNKKENITMNEIQNENVLLNDIKEIIDAGKNAAFQSVNVAMIMTYWQIGKRIVTEEQSGNDRAEYGTHLIDKLSSELTAVYGKGFTARALRQYRKFYMEFTDIEKWNACVPFLTWTHFRSLLRVENIKAREWYLQEAVSQTWSSRTLDRNISTQYYERLLLSQNTKPVVEEMKAKTEKYQNDKLEFIKNPVVAEFWACKIIAILLRVNWNKA